uniref:Uncharacterized protein n=1 Tax=Meloidogyne javanica TaxID=6303 RepID=A0A915N5V6_MELJA
MPTENGEAKMLVEDEKQDMRISNQFLLGSPNSGIAPFVQFNGKYYEGFDNIKEAVKHLGKKKLLENDREAEIISISENYLLKILTKDKTTRHRKIGGKKSGGLDYLIKDNGVRAQFFQSHPQLFEWRWQEIVLNNDKKIKFEMGFEFWNEFFAIERGIENLEIDEKEILTFLEKHLAIILGSDVSSDGVGSYNYSYSDGTAGSSHSLNKEINNDYLWNLDDWQYFYEWMAKFVEAKLEEYFTKEKNSMEGKVGEINFKIDHNISHIQLREYLHKHSWDQVSDEKIYESFEKIIQKIVNMLGSQRFLFGDQPSLGEKPEREDIESIGKAIVIEQKSKNNCEIEEEGPSFIENCGELEENDKYIDKRIGHLHSYVELFWPDKNDEDRKMYGKIILHSIAAAYCNLGKGKPLEDANKCQKIHKNKAVELKQYVVDDAGKTAFNEKGSYFSSAPSVNTVAIKQNIDFHVRSCLKIAYETIQKYNENGIVKNVEEAINKAWITKKNEGKDLDNKQDNQRNLD